MKRSELREHIFKMLFSYEFNSDSEMPEQIRLYFEQMDEEEPKEMDIEYILVNSINVIMKS